MAKRSRVSEQLADRVAIAIILAAGTLSTAWVFIVPIFQAPDEPAHFDYAASIYDAHRLVRVSDGQPNWIVSPYTKYLLRASDFFRIERHSSMRVPPGYGTATFFASLDAGARNLSNRASPSGKINYIVPFYPFAFYALEALWMGAVAELSHSLTAAFFSGRLLCVFLMMLSLYFNYRTALSLGVPRWTSVTLIGAIGFFPLTSFVSSYIQPDNLAYLLVSAVLFCATALRSGPLSLARFAALGVSLGLLAVTKYQFFLAAAFPAAILVGIRLARDRLPPARLWRRLALLLAPSAALLSIQHWFVNSHGPSGSGLHSDMTLQYFASTLALGFDPTLHYIGKSLTDAFVDFYVSGSCAVTYWQVVGWFDTPIVIVNDHVESLIRLVISLMTVSVAVILAYGVARRSYRSVFAFFRGHARLASQALFGDAVLGSYLCFTAIMFTLYVLTANAFTAEGRHWYPFVFPAFLSLVWYAPRTLNKRHPRLSLALACLLLCYAVVASAYALGDVIGRYYGPSTAQYVTLDRRPHGLPPKDAAGVLYPIERAAYHVNGSTFPFSFQVGTELFVSGVVLPKDSDVPDAVLFLDDRVPIGALNGQYEQNVAEAAHSVREGYGGFRAYISTSRLSEGPHTITAYGRVSESSRYQRIAPARTFFLTTGNGGFSPSFLRSLEREPEIAGTLRLTGTCRGSSVPGSPPTAAAGSVLLIAGRLRDPREITRYTTAWLLTDNQPYPAVYNKDGSYVGTIPTAMLSEGVHHASAFVARDVSRSDRISAKLVFGVRSSPDSAAQILNLRQPVCLDPLKLLAGTY